MTRRDDSNSSIWYDKDGNVGVGTSSAEPPSTSTLKQQAEAELRRIFSPWLDDLKMMVSFSRPDVSVSVSLDKGRYNQNKMFHFVCDNTYNLFILERGYKFFFPVCPRPDDYQDNKSSPTLIDRRAMAGVLEFIDKYVAAVDKELDEVSDAFMALLGGRLELTRDDVLRNLHSGFYVLFRIGGYRMEIDFDAGLDKFKLLSREMDASSLTMMLDREGFAKYLDVLALLPESHLLALRYIKTMEKLEAL